MILEALKKCWASCFSERVMRHRLDNGMPTTGLKMAVIIQVRSCCMLSTCVAELVFNVFKQTKLRMSGFRLFEIDQIQLEKHGEIIVTSSHPPPHTYTLTTHQTHTHPHAQVMVNSAVSGVAFSRHPLSPITKDVVLVEAVYGLGEGLVSGELEADRYEVSIPSG